MGLTVVLLTALVSAGLASNASAAVDPSVVRPAADRAEIHPIDLSDPGAGITDPVAGVETLDRNCTSGQVDINTATATAIGSALKINSQPTLNRIVDGRPWLVPMHLISVPGVGPSKKSLLASSACATPTVLPPVSENHPKAGRGDGEVDLQVATVERIMTLGLARPVAERLAAARPLPDDLHQVAAPAVPGLADSKIDEVIRKGAVVTPHPFSYRGKSWKWVSHDHGAVVKDAADGRYTLTVPTGRVAGDGAWATASKLPNFEQVLPAGDFHIYGQWTPALAVQLPTLPGVGADELMAMHDGEEGPQASMAPNVWVGNGVFRAPATSLSTFTVTSVPVQCQSWLTFCNNGTSLTFGFDDPLTKIMRDRTAWLRSQGVFSGGGPCGQKPMPLRVTSTGDLPNGVDCMDVTAPDSTATFMLKNLTNDSQIIFGNVFQLTASGPGTARVQPNAPETFGAVTTTLFNGQIDRGLVPPGYTIKVTAEQGAGPTTVRLQSSRDAWAFWAASQVTSILDLTGVGPAAGCLSAALTNNSANAVIDCVVRTAEPALQALLDRTPDKASTKALKLGSAIKVLKAFGKVVAVGDGVLSAFLWLDAVSPADSQYQFHAPPPPVGGGGLGGPAGAGHFIAKPPTGNAYFVDVNAHTAEVIPDDATLECLAEGYYMLDLIEQYPASDGTIRLNVQGDPKVLPKEATCTDVSPKWTYTPVALGGNVPNGAILRVAWPDGNWAGRINEQGALEWIEDWPTYQCLTKIAPVIYAVPWEKIRAWQPAGTKNATCGDPL